MRVLRRQRITSLDAGGHGLDMSDGQSWLVEDSLIDLSACQLEELDEAAGITWGSRALFRRCRIRGAGKLLLCGSGDADKLAVERGKTVIFEDCILEDFGRRGPEVQSCMRVILRRCLIRNWGEPGRFDVRAFAAWAHHGGRIEAESCVFDQPRFWHGWRLMARDWLAHLGQAWNDEGLRGLLRPAGWLPGVCRGLTATAGGHVRAENCRATRWWIRLEGHRGPRSGMMRNGKCFPQPPLVPLTGASACLLLPTPTVTSLTRSIGFYLRSNESRENASNLSAYLIGVEYGLSGKAAKPSGTHIPAPSFIEWMMGVPEGWTIP